MLHCYLVQLADEENEGWIEINYDRKSNELKNAKIIEVLLCTAVGTCYSHGLTACVVYGKFGNKLKNDKALPNQRALSYLLQFCKVFSWLTYLRDKHKEITGTMFTEFEL
jgi:hypothetical protein